MTGRGGPPGRPGWPMSPDGIAQIIEFADLARKPLRTHGTNPPTAHQGMRKQQNTATPPEAAQALRPTQAAAAITMTELSALRRPPTPATPFPELPGLIGKVVAAIEDLTQAPRAICGNSALAAVALATQGHADIRLPNGQVNPISLFLVTVAESGARKSSADRFATQGIRDEESRLEANYATEDQRHKRSLELRAVQRQQILKPGGMDTPEQREQRALALAEMGAEPEAPPQPMFTVTEPTLQGLYRSLKEGQATQGVFSDEGAQFVGGHAMKDDNRLQTSAGLSSLWDGLPVRVSRGGAGNYVLAGRRVSMHMMLQPQVAARFLGARDLEDQGLVSRMLPAYPGSTMGTRMYRDPSPESTETVAGFAKEIARLLRTPLPERRPALPLSTEAKGPWRNFHNQVEEMLGPGGELESIKGLANKLPEHALRIAAVVTLFADIGATQIELPALASGIALAQYYAEEARRLKDAGFADPNVTRAELALRWIFEKVGGDPFPLHVLYQAGPRDLRTAADARAAASLLRDHGWLEQLPAGFIVDGTPRKEAYKLTAAAFARGMWQ